MGSNHVKKVLPDVHIIEHLKVKFKVEYSTALLAKTRFFLVLVILNLVLFVKYDSAHFGSRSRPHRLSGLDPNVLEDAAHEILKHFCTQHISWSDVEFWKAHMSCIGLTSNAHTCSLKL